jgi:hypothetical protein
MTILAVFLRYDCPLTDTGYNVYDDNEQHFGEPKNPGVTQPSMADSGSHTSRKRKHSPHVNTSTVTDDVRAADDMTPNPPLPKKRRVCAKTVEFPPKLPESDKLPGTAKTKPPLPANPLVWAQVSIYRNSLIDIWLMNSSLRLGRNCVNR